MARSGARQRQGKAHADTISMPSSSSSAQQQQQQQQQQQPVHRAGVVANRRVESLAAAAAVQRFVSLISLDVDMDHTRQLQLRNKQLTVLPPQLGTLLQQIRKLDLTGNDLSDLRPLNTLPHLSNLVVSLNPHLRSLSGLQCKHLTVLTVSGCGLQSLDGLQASAASLRALIANDNSLMLESPPSSLPLQHDEEGGNHSARGADKASLNGAKGHGTHHKAHTTRARSGPAKAAGTPNSKSVHREKYGGDGGVADWALARREWTMHQLNYAVLATLTQCETVVLSRNPRLCELFVDSEESLTDDSPNAQSESAERSSVRDKEKEAAALTTQHQQTQSDHRRDTAVADRHPLSVFSKLPRLKKLSLTACGIRVLPRRWFLPMVTELRLAHNSLNSLQPEGVIARSLKILDVSHNVLNTITTLRRCHFVQHIHLAGNPLLAEYARRDAEEDAETAPEAETKAEAKAPTPKVPRALQRALRRMLKHLLAIDGDSLLSDEVLRKRRRVEPSRSAKSPEGPTHSDDEEKDGEEKDGEGDRQRERRRRDEVGDAVVAAERVPTTPPLHTRQEDSDEEDNEEEEQKDKSAVQRVLTDAADVAMDAPESVMRATHAPVIRRVRPLQHPSGESRKAREPTLTGSEAVKVLLQQRQDNTSTGW